MGKRLMKRALTLGLTVLLVLNLTATVFADGNKRTALIAFLTFLELNDFPVHNQDWIILYHLIYDVAKGKSNVDSIVTWLYYFN